VALILYLLFGVAMFWHSFPRRVFSEEAYIYDLIWLDAWAVAFILVAVFIWYARMSESRRAVWLIGAFSWFGFIGVSLIFAGSPFYLGGYGGDALFHTAMVLKYKTFIWPVDFFYKGLPTFYPPVYYWLLGLMARVFSIEAYHALKLGGMTLYLIGPMLLYLQWRRFTPPTLAAFASIISFLFVSFGHAILFLAPHAFLGNAFFIPWWLYYVEQVHVRQPNRSFYLWGGLIGGLIFMTYYVPFFLGALILLIRLLSFGRLRTFWRASSRFRWHPALAVLALAALFSSPYWGPMLWSMVTIANDAAQQEWHQFGSSGIALKFFEFSMQGVLFLVAVLWLARRVHRPLNRGLLLILLTLFPFLFIGSVLGALDHPVNLIKLREFTAVLGGPVVGLLVGFMLRFGERRRRGFRWAALAGMVIVLFLVSGLVEFGKNGGVKQARLTAEENWGFTEQQAAEFEGKVFLTGHHSLYCFYPVYAFLFANQHYAHPAADYTTRFRFLELLQQAPDSYLFWVCLRYNRFDAVDYYWPLSQGGDFTIPANLSNYPNGHEGRTLVYPERLTEDSTLFVKATEFGVFEVASEDRANAIHDCPSAESAAEMAEWLGQIRTFLNPEGRQLASDYVGNGRTGGGK